MRQRNKEHQEPAFLPDLKRRGLQRGGMMEALDEAEFGSGFPCRDFQAAVRRVNNRAGIVIN